MSRHARSWLEVADGVVQARYEPLDVTVTVIRGASGLVVVDTRSSHREADEVRADLAASFGRVPVRAIVNTHAHFDHTFGNARFGPASDLGAPIYGHERVPAHLDAYERPRLAAWIATGTDPVDDWRAVEITPPTQLVGGAASIDLGDRGVDLRHFGRGHTDNDLLLHLPDTEVWIVGDLVEESGPPMFGSGSYPLEWSRTLERLLDHTSPEATIVPGHGAVVDRAFVRAQAADLRVIADLLRDLFAAGVPVDDAVAAGAGRWPWPAGQIENAVADAYAFLRTGAPRPVALPVDGHHKTPDDATTVES